MAKWGEGGGSGVYTRGVGVPSGKGVVRGVPLPDSVHAEVYMWSCTCEVYTWSEVVFN